MKYLHPVAMVPNTLIDDTTVHYTTKAVALALLFLSGRKNKAVKVTVAELARLCHCSTATVQQAVAELLRGGYITKRRSYRYSTDHNRLVYGANVYVWLKRHGGYTLLNREILDYKLTPSSLASLLFLYRCAGRSGRAFPSIRQMAGLLKKTGKMGLDMAKSTVCLALKSLRILQAVVRHCCNTKQGCYASNSYYLTNMVITGGAGCRTCGEGSPKFDKPKFINQITEGFTKRERKNGVRQFGNLHSFEAGLFQEQLFYFDGTGVKVSACDEPDLTA